MRKKWVFLLLLLVLFLAVVVWTGGRSQERTEIKDPAVFHYDPAKVDAGNMYHYHYSTIDGEQLHDLYMYINAGNQIEFLASGYAIYQGLHMYSLTFQEHLVSEALAINLLADLKLPSSAVRSEGIYDYENRQFSARQIQLDRRGERKVGGGVMRFRIIPTFEYSMEGMDLGYAFRFLDKEADDFFVGLSVMGQAVDMKVSYVGDEEINGIMARRYQLQGRGLLARLFKARIDLWLTKDDPRQYMVKYVGHLRRFPYFKNVKLELQEIKPMSREEWEELLQGEIEKAKKAI